MEIDSESLPSTMGMSTGLDEDLMERLRSITTSNHEDLICQFRTTTNAVLTDDGCTFFLEMNNWSVGKQEQTSIEYMICCYSRNLNAAILAYYDAEMPTDKIPQMQFIADVTISEGEIIPANTRFVKTWRIENSGRHFIVMSHTYQSNFVLFRQRIMADKLFATICQW
jgi:hypothetical protein